ncbi:MAG: hypothetical protein QOF20_403 [Acidimicrobiaceae bacterium]|nr:hypothetical protein [Acidimicrobiaceae bacterium]
MSDYTSFLSAWAAAERTRDVGVGPLGFELSKTAWLARHDGATLKYETSSGPTVPWPSSPPARPQLEHSKATLCPRSSATRCCSRVRAGHGSWREST